MKLVADNKIPEVRQLFGNHPDIDIELLPASDISREKLINAHALLVRTRTEVNEALLTGTDIRFVGTASTGYDHLDVEWLEGRGIQWTTASGANAEAVAEYILCSLAWLQQSDYLPLSRSLKVGIIGVGAVGTLVSEKLSALGFDVYHNDPPREESEYGFSNTPLKEFGEMDCITLHVPLTESGNYPTRHMVNGTLLKQLKAGTVLINTSRGEVINTRELKANGSHLGWCFDVWPGEPSVDIELLRAALLATPHIAGYSRLAKQRAVGWLYRDFCSYFNLSPVDLSQSEITVESTIIAGSWQEAVLKAYQPSCDDKMLRQALTMPEGDRRDYFTMLRQNYSLRPEFSQISVSCYNAELKPILERIGFRVNKQ